MCVPIGSDDEGDRCSVAEVSQAEQFRPSPGSGGTIDSIGSTTLADVECDVAPTFGSATRMEYGSIERRLLRSTQTHLNLSSFAATGWSWR
jgi:hypothetical protein